MANAAALIWETLPDLNWAGFYRNVGGELVLGPFQGRPACIRIPFGKGVCGAAAATLQVQRVEDVHAFPGHIACDAASASELVVPIVRDGEADRACSTSTARSPARFTEEDEAGCVALVRAAREGALAQLLQPLVARAMPGMIITGQGSLPASLPVKLRDQRARDCRSALRRGPARRLPARSPTYSRTTFIGSPLRMTIDGFDARLRP